MPRTEEANQRIREERRGLILDVAAGVLARKGLAGARIADFAAAGEMSQGLIFRYFASKEEVFAAVVEKALQSATSLAQAALLQPCSPLEKLRWLLQIYLPGMWYKPEYALVILNALNSEATPQEVRELTFEQSKLTLQLYRQLIVKGKEAGEAVQRDPPILTLAFSPRFRRPTSSSRPPPPPLSLC